MDSGFYQFEDSYDVKAIIDKKYHLWTIEDTKDGDVLVTDDMIVLFKKRLENDSILTYFHYDTIDDEYEPGACLYYAHIYPATKEQRDLLFKKMKEAGYEWDAEKKELKKVRVIDEGKAEMDYCFTKMMKGEKVSSAWSEEDERAIGIIKIALEHPYNMEGKWDRKFALDWLESLKDKIRKK